MIDYLKVIENAAELYGCIKTDIFSFILKKLTNEFDEDEYYDWINDNLDIENEIFKFVIDNDDLYIVDKLNTKEDIETIKSMPESLDYYYPKTLDEFINITTKPLWQFEDENALHSLFKLFHDLLGREKGNEAALEFVNEVLKDGDPIGYMKHFDFSFPDENLKDLVITLSFLCASNCRLQKFKANSTKDLLLIEVKNMVLKQGADISIKINNEELKHMSTIQLKEHIINDEKIDDETKKRMIEYLEAEIEKNKRVA